MGRTAIGVKAITLSSKDDSVIGMVVMEDENQQILVISEKVMENVHFYQLIEKLIVLLKV